MKRAKFLTWLVFLTIALPVQKVEANRNSSSGQDPLANINYRDAFNQTKIHERFKNLMVALGCAENVFSEFAADDVQDIKQPRPGMQKAYEIACLRKMQSARRWSISEPARESLVVLGLLITAAVLTREILHRMSGDENSKNDSVGASFSVLSAVFNGVFLLQDTIRSGYNFVFPPQSALNRLEDLFAKNQCFIPRALWPVIIEKFMLAKQNSFEQRKCMDFIEFTLDLTTYKPKPPLQKHAITAQAVIQELHRRIDQFFNDYDDNSDGESCRILKVNIAKFILDLFGKSQTSRYIYLCGPGGIGKTYFVHTLCGWIEDLLPGSVQFEDLIITSSEELEGSKQRPGALLRVLRNQLKANKHGSVIFMDEAIWLNDASMVSCAKRVFNDDQSKLSTTYFGDGIDGTGINLKMLPMLVFVANNDEIKDPALKSRFDTIKYPLPKQDALVAHALTTAKRSLILDETTIPTASGIRSWIGNKSIDNFRQVEANIEQFILSQ